MRTSTYHNIIYEYRLTDTKESIRCSLKNSFHSRRDFIKIEEEGYTTSDRVKIIGFVVLSCIALYGVLSIMV